MSESLRIRLPPMSSLVVASMEDSEQLKRVRKRPKRYQRSDEEFDDSDSDLANTTNAPLRSRHSSVVEAAPKAEAIVELGEEIEEEEAHHSEHSEQRATSTQAKGRAKRMLAGEGQPPKKRARKVLVSEDEDEFLDQGFDPMPEPEEDDDALLPVEKPTKGTKGKGKASSTTKATKGTKRKAKTDAHDARHSGETKQSPPDPLSAKRLKPSLKLDEIVIDVVGDVNEPEASAAGINPSSPLAARHDSPAPPPKKSKLPTIKKNRVPGSGLNTPTSATASSKSGLLGLATSNKSTQETSRKNLTGASDIDLSNKSIYEEIFSKAALADGGTPRAGGALNRRSKEEERRKELNRLRDEDKARRASEATQSFDLQAQLDKIGRFEERLRGMHSSALYPNFMAAKWREEWEKEKRRVQKEKEWQEAAFPNHLNCVEEGEVK